MANTVRIAERCNVDIPKDVSHLPEFAVPDGFTTDAYFEHIVREGFKRRLTGWRELEAAASCGARSPSTRRGCSTKST